MQHYSNFEQLDFLYSVLFLISHQGLWTILPIDLLFFFEQGHRSKRERMLAHGASWCQLVLAGASWRLPAQSKPKPKPRLWPKAQGCSFELWGRAWDQLYADRVVVVRNWLGVRPVIALNFDEKWLLLAKQSKLAISLTGSLVYCNSSLACFIFSCMMY